MGWTAPYEWTAGEVVTAAKLNEQLYYNARYLKGLDGTITLSDGVDMGANELTINSLEIVGVDGEVNKTVVEDHTHADGANCGTIDHGVTTGRSNDDHTIYALRTILTTRGDMVFRNATVWVRLAKGTEGYFLKQGADDPEWALGIATREIFVPVSTGGAGGVTTTYGSYPVVNLSNGQLAYSAFRVPYDFTGITNAEIIVIPRATQGAADWNIASYYASVGEAYNTHTENDAATTYNVTDNQIYAVDISGILSSIVAGDMVGIQIAVGTAGHAVDVLGIRFRYT